MGTFVLVPVKSEVIWILGMVRKSFLYPRPRRLERWWDCFWMPDCGWAAFSPLLWCTFCDISSCVDFLMDNLVPRKVPELKRYRSWNRGVPMASRRGRIFLAGFLTVLILCHAACHCSNSGTLPCTSIFFNVIYRDVFLFNQLVPLISWVFYVNIRLFLWLIFSKNFFDTHSSQILTDLLLQFFDQGMVNTQHSSVKLWALEKIYYKNRNEIINFRVHLWTWSSWRGQSKLPNEHSLECCVKQQTIIGRFPCFLLQHTVTACRACAATRNTMAVPVPF